jgi:hypothetical protein
MQRRIVTLVIAFALSWIGLAALYSQTPPAPRVGCKVDQQQISTGGSTQFVIFADQLPPLTAFNLTLTYDFNALQFQDQDLSTIDVINLKPGDAFPATAFSQNNVNSVNGQIQIAVSPPVSSTITGDYDKLAEGTILGINQAVAPFRFTQAVLYDHNGLLMNTTTYAVEECFVQVGNSGAPTPTSTATYFLSPLLTATPLPTGHTSVAPTPTTTPTLTETPTTAPSPVSPLDTPTFTPFPTATPFPTLTPTDTDTPIPTETPTETPTATTIIFSTPQNQSSENLSPLETPVPTDTEIPVLAEIPTDTPTLTDTPIASPTDTPELDPLPTATEVPIQETPTATATPIRPPTPTVVAQINRQIVESVEPIEQAAAIGPPRRQQPYRLLAVAALFGTLTLALAFWQLHRRE